MNTTIKEMANGIFMARLPMPFRLSHVNVFLFIEEDGFAMIDTGPNLPGVMDALEDVLARIGRKVEKCRRIFITHFHMDHCGLAAIVRERSGAPISLSEIDAQKIRAFSIDHDRVRRMEAFALENGLDRDTIKEVSDIFLSFEKATVPFIADGYLSDQDHLFAGGHDLTVISTPGHSRGHLSFYLPTERALIAGDHLLQHITPNLSPDLIDPAFHPLESYLESLTRIEKLEIGAIWPSHGRPFTNMAGRIADIRKHHAERSLLALQALEEGARTARQVSQSIFGRDLSAFDRMLAMNESYVHLIALEKRGLCGRKKNSAGVCLFEHSAR